MAHDPLQYTTPFLLTPTHHRDPYPFISPPEPQPHAVVLITGGGSGIGAATARVWARAQAEAIVLVGRRVEKLEDVAESIRALDNGTKVLTIGADVARDADLERVHAKVKETYGRAADVVIACAAATVLPAGGARVGDVGVEDWWFQFEVNTRGLYSLVHRWIRSQTDPENPRGTLVYLSGGLEALTMPGVSGISASKLAAHRVVENIHVEYPTLRAFTLLPGIVATDAMAGNFLGPYALDHEDMTGLVALWLVQPRADFMRGRLVQVNWDLAELESRKDEVVQRDMLKIASVPALPVNGGKGFAS